MPSDEEAACTPRPLNPRGLNPKAVLPHGCRPEHVYSAMEEFLQFLGFINTQLHSRSTQRLETFLMPANFSSIVGEFMKATIPKYCKKVAVNRYHNGHPDLIPTGVFLGDAVQHSNNGIEVKASRYLKGWQGHNPEDIWLMVVVFECNRPRDPQLGIQPKPFAFTMVVAAQLTKADWKFAGRSETSRRTITASVVETGYDKLVSNWIYRQGS